MSTPLEELVPLSDNRAAVLLSTSGVVEYGCDAIGSSAHFARVLGHRDHGDWALAPIDGGRADRSGWQGDTAVLVQEWTTSGGTVRISSFMPPQPHRGAPSRLHQVIEGVTGSVLIRSEFAPRFEDGRLPGHSETLVRPDGSRALRLSAGPVTLRLDGPAHRLDACGRWTADFTVSAGERIALTLTIGNFELGADTVPHAHTDLRATLRDWDEWTARLTYTGPNREAVLRSAMLLRGLTIRGTGAVAAALTRSLPELIGGERNWDYEACWLRDAALTIHALVSVGFLDEAARWRGWLLRAVAGDVTKIAIMYRLDGGRTLTERELDWLPGYEGSRPVRAGNAAATQRQNDVYGEVIQALVAAEHAGLPADPGIDALLPALGEEIVRIWRQPDAGIWEVRGPERRFVHSALMCWQGLQLLVEWAEARTRTRVPVVDASTVARWAAERDTIKADILQHAFDPDLRAFTQYYGGRELDAAVLLMATNGFLPPDDKRLVCTIDAISRELTDPAGFVRRYIPAADGRVDGLTDDEGAFLACSFHLVQSLAYIGRTADANELFGKLLALRTPHGVMTEMWDAERKRPVGNMPQAFTLWSLIGAALALEVRPGGGTGHVVLPGQRTQNTTTTVAV
ncbi:glycoside hydrolase family 15 protein [Kitasatospora sp. MBT63]|uniref:glycoside hydrolase family 15 protein n=1 Tax=Kitasatospora sp. MBT63 TaxID=1444768 RepID=UPI0011EA6C9B|nr:glycoside hydrolase family 15 protein [Kitasatospora sp. MBT63]